MIRDLLLSPHATKAELKQVEEAYRAWFGARVEGAREEQDMKVVTLMERLGVNRNQVNKWRRGKNWGHPVVIGSVSV